MKCIIIIKVFEYHFFTINYISFINSQILVFKWHQELEKEILVFKFLIVDIYIFYTHIHHYIASHFLVLLLII